jgi:hypothetical protein
MMSADSSGHIIDGDLVMSRSRRFVPLVILVVTISPFILGYSAVQSTALQTTPGECSVTVSGKEKPYRVPAQLVWEATFKRISADPSTAVRAGIDGPRSLRLAASGTSALARANALRQSLPTAPTAGLPRQVSQDRDLVIADSILDARDTELRDLSTDEFERLTDYALETASTLDVTLPIAGRIASDDFGNRYCEVTARGTDHPHLVEENQLWRLMFINLTAAIELSNERFGGITAEQFVRQLRMPIDDIRVFVRVARDTATKEKELRAALLEATAEPTAEQYKQLEARVLRLVMSGRHTILRSIAPDSWRALMRHVDLVRSNTTSRYRSPLSQ